MFCKFVAFIRPFDVGIWMLVPGMVIVCCCWFACACCWLFCCDWFCCWPFWWDCACCGSRDCSWNSVNLLLNAFFCVYQIAKPSDNFFLVLNRAKRIDILMKSKFCLNYRLLRLLILCICVCCCLVCLLILLRLCLLILGRLSGCKIAQWICSQWNWYICPRYCQSSLAKSCFPFESIRSWLFDFPPRFNSKCAIRWLLGEMQSAPKDREKQTKPKIFMVSVMFTPNVCKCVLK